MSAALEHTLAISGKPRRDGDLRMSARIGNGFRLLAGVLLATLLAACHRAPDEARVRAAIADTGKAVQAVDAGATVAALSEDFDGNDGALGRRDIANLVRLIRLRGEHVGVTMGPVSVERRADRLLAHVTVTLTRGSGVLPDQLGVYRIESAWRQQAGEWRCYHASWNQPQ
jgi:ketosteroid isomerase-like protein